VAKFDYYVLQSSILLSDQNIVEHNHLSGLFLTIKQIELIMINYLSNKWEIGDVGLSYGRYYEFPALFKFKKVKLNNLQ
jgi:hypothetical protein